MHRLIFFITTLFLLSSCGPIASKAAQAVNKNLGKSTKELAELPDNIIARNINETSLVAKDITDFNTYISRTFRNDPEINYLFKINEKYSQLPKDWTNEFDDIWQSSIRNNEDYYDDLYFKYFYESFKQKEDLFKFLPKAESVLIASILGFGFTYTDDLGAAQGGMIKDKEIRFKPLTDREIKTIQCSQVHDIVSIRTNTSYTAFIKNLENCPEIKLNLEKLKKRLKKM